MSKHLANYVGKDIQIEFQRTIVDSTDGKVVSADETGIVVAYEYKGAQLEQFIPHGSILTCYVTTQAAPARAKKESTETETEEEEDEDED